MLSNTTKNWRKLLVRKKFQIEFFQLLENGAKKWQQAISTSRHLDFEIPIGFWPSGVYKMISSQTQTCYILPQIEKVSKMKMRPSTTVRPHLVRQIVAKNFRTK